MCWYITDSRASRSRSRRMAELAQRKVVDFQVKSRTLLESNAQGFRLQPTWFYCAASKCTVVRSSVGLRDVSWLVVCKNFHKIADLASLVSWCCLIHRVLVVSPCCRSSHWARPRPSPQCGLHLWCSWSCELAGVPAKGLDTAIATHISAGDTIIKVVYLLCRCVDSGNTQALYCMDKDVLVDVQHHTWTKVGFTLLCTVTQKACGLSRGGKWDISLFGSC